MLSKTLMTGAATPVILCSSLLALAMTGCNRGADSSQSAASGQNAQAANPNAPLPLRGTVISDTANVLVLRSDTGDVTVKMVQPFRLYTRVPSSLSQVKEGVFIGVTTIKQPDGTERATEIHIFPEELRGLGEGSRMMAPVRRGGASRMTNGIVSTSPMTNGAASQSRMSNGSVASANGSSVVVHYAGGSQNVTVPPNTAVTELKVATKGIAVGDQVAVVVKKAADGSLSSDKALSTAR